MGLRMINKEMVEVCVSLPIKEEIIVMVIYNYNIIYNSFLIIWICSSFGLCYIFGPYIDSYHN